MQFKDDFTDTLNNLSMEELKELEWTLESCLTRAKNSNSIDINLIESINQQLLLVKNRITALKIRS